MLLLARLLIFVAVAIVGVAHAQSEPEQLRAEIVFWESIRASQDPADFRAYLEQYPQGKFAALARNRLAALGHAPAPASTPSSPPAQAPSTASDSRMPRAGDTWTYRLTALDPATRKFNVRRYTVRVSAVGDNLIFDRFDLDGGATGEASHNRGKYLVSLGPFLFSPYLPVFEELPAAGRLSSIEIKDENCRLNYRCEAEGWIAGRETVRVPAGTFEAVKVVVKQNLRPSVVRGQVQPIGWTGSRELTVWYAPGVKRALKFTSRASGPDAPSDSHFDLELESYHVQ